MSSECAPPRHGFEPAASGSRREFRLLHQLVCLSGLDLPKQRLTGFTELTVAPLSNKLEVIRLHCARHVQVASVTVNDMDVSFELLDRRVELRAALSKCDRSAKSLADALYANAIDYDNGGAQLLVKLPTDTDEELRACVSRGELLKVGIDFVVLAPATGLHFVLPPGCGRASGSGSGRESTASPAASHDGPAIHDPQLRAAHVYTGRTGRAACSGTSAWLPCVDAPAELCLWRIEVTVDAHLTVVCSGELTETTVSADRQRTTYHFVLGTPTSAVNIGFAIGAFESTTCADIADVTSYCPPGLKPLLEHTLAGIAKLIEFFEELLSYRFPYLSYKIVFVDHLAEDMASFAGVTLMSVSFLYGRCVLETVQHTRTMLASALVGQYFGCFVTQAAWLDVWVVRGLARYLTMLYLEHAFGSSEYHCQTHSTLRAVCDYETRHGPIILRPLAAETRARDVLHFDPRLADTCLWAHCDALAKKAHLVFRMLERRLGKEPFFHVLHQLLAVAGRAAALRDKPAQWGSVLVSTDSLFATVSSVTGQELPTFLENWVYGGGHAHFAASYVYNRKRSLLELELVQDETQHKGTMFYMGPVTVSVQELDGFYSHTMHVDDRRAKLDLPVATKGRKLKKKKVPLAIGEEVDVDLTGVDTDCPVLWVRLDADMQLVRVVEMAQVESAWQLTLRHERDVVAQMHAVDVLQKFATQPTVDCMADTLANTNVFYRVRVACALALASVANQQATLGSGVDLLSAGALPQSPIMQFWERTFTASGCTKLPRELSFAPTPDKLVLYFMLQAVTQSMANLRAPNGEVRDDALSTLFNMLYYMDNNKNRYSADHYRATVLGALGQAASLVRRPAAPPSKVADMPATAQRVLQEVVLAMNSEKLQPSYHRVVLSACLRCLCVLQRAGFLPIDAELFWLYFDPSQFIKVTRMQVRQTAAECIADVAFALTCAGDWHKSVALLCSLVRNALADSDVALVSLVLRAIAVRLGLVANNVAGAVGATSQMAQLTDMVWKAIGSVGEDVRTQLELFEMFAALQPIGCSVERLPQDLPTATGTSSEQLEGASTQSRLSQPNSDQFVLDRL